MVAPDAEIDLSALGAALDQPAAPEFAAFLAEALQGDPELALLVMEAALALQQEKSAPYLPFLLGPSAMGGEEA